MLSRGSARWGLLAAASVVVFAGCPSRNRDPEEAIGRQDEVWRNLTTYRDPDGRFEIDFPAEPEVSEEVENAGTRRELVRHDLKVSVGDDWEFILAWSDAPAGSDLALSQEIREGTAVENADRDEGIVADQHDVEVFGRTGLEFTVEGGSPSWRYLDLMVKLGGRLYELTVIQQTGSRDAFDRFVDSFHLLEPPVETGADFFGAAEQACASTLGSLPEPPAEATPAERGAGIDAVVDGYETLVDQLSTTSAAPDQQGDAAAFIDSIRRSLGPAREFAEAVRNDAPNVEELGRATHADTDLTLQLAEDNGASSCV